LIIRRYFIKEILVTFVALTGVLYLIYISNRFVRYLADAATGNLSADAILLLLGLKSISSLPVLIPLSLYLAILIGLGRLYKDSEMVVMAACGVGNRTVLNSVLWIALIIGLGLSYVTLYVVPWAQQKSQEIQQEAAASADFTGIAAGRFNEFEEGELVFYAETMSKDQSVMENVFAEGVQEGAMNVLTADRAIQQVDPVSGDRFLVFMNGYRYQGTPGSETFRIIKYEEHGVRIVRKPVASREDRLETRTTDSLWRAKSTWEQAELQWRIAMPLSTILLAMAAVPLSKANPRQGRFAKLFTAILLYVVYSNLMGVARTWLQHGAVPVQVGIWWVHLSLLAFFGILWLKQNGVAWTMGRLLGRRQAL
jgi:lipopolysaccharide export system permease protein